MEVLVLADVASLRVLNGTGGDPLGVDLAGSWIHLDAAGDRIAERFDLRIRVRGKHVDGRTECLAAIRRRRDVDLAHREVVVADVDLVLVGREGARVDSEPRAIDGRRVGGGDLVRRPVSASVVGVGQVRLQERGQALERRLVHEARTRKTGRGRLRARGWTTHGDVDVADVVAEGVADGRLYERPAAVVGPGDVRATPLPGHPDGPVRGIH